MIKQKTPDSNIPQVLHTSIEKDSLKVTIILPAVVGKQKGRTKILNYSEIKKHATGFMVGDEKNPKELLLDARIYTNS